MTDPKKHPRKRELESIMKEFEKISRSSKILDFILEEAGDYAYKRIDCADLYGDYDEDPISPSVDIYEVHEDKWLPKLRKADKKFDDLCKKFIEVYMSTLDDNRKNRQEAEEWLSEAVAENFWVALPAEYTDELEDVWDALREDCDDQAAERRDPYGYRGLSRRDFMASEKKNLLIKLAASLPKGDKSRRAILAGLNKSSYYEDYDDTSMEDAEYYFDKVDSSLLSLFKRLGLKIRRNGSSDHEFFEEDSFGAVGEWTKGYTFTSPRGHIDISVSMYHNSAGDPLWYYYAVTGGADWIPSTGWGKIDGEAEEEDPKRFVDKVLKDIEAVLAY